jgi:hypothetical protein
MEGGILPHPITKNGHDRHNRQKNIFSFYRLPFYHLSLHILCAQDMSRYPFTLLF